MLIFEKIDNYLKLTEQKCWRDPYLKTECKWECLRKTAALTKKYLHKMRIFTQINLPFDTKEFTSGFLEIAGTLCTLIGRTSEKTSTFHPQLEFCRLSHYRLWEPTPLESTCRIYKNFYILSILCRLRYGHILQAAFYTVYRQLCIVQRVLWFLYIFFSKYTRFGQLWTALKFCIQNIKSCFLKLHLFSRFCISFFKFFGLNFSLVFHSSWAP